MIEYKDFLREKKEDKIIKRTCTSKVHFKSAGTCILK